MTITYQDELCTLICGSSPAAFDEVGDFDLVVTSPPYNLGTTTGGGFNAKSMSAGDFESGYVEHDDAMPHDDYVAWQCDVLRGLWERLPDHGAIYYNVKARVQAGTLIHPLRWVPPEMNVRQVIVWDKNIVVNFLPTFFAPCHELIILFAKPDYRLASKSEGMDVWRIAPGASMPTGRQHPCPFPDEIPRRAIRSSANVTRVFDPFTGSGTTMAVAKSMGVPSVGVELSTKYCNLASQRLSITYHEPSLFG